MFPASKEIKAREKKKLKTEGSTVHSHASNPRLLLGVSEAEYLLKVQRESAVRGTHAGTQVARGCRQRLEAGVLWGSVLPVSALPEVTAPLPQPGPVPSLPSRDSWNNVTISHPIPTESAAFSLSKK